MPGTTISRNPVSRSRVVALLPLFILVVSIVMMPTSAKSMEQEKVALILADYLRSARTVISQNQDLINSLTPHDKGLTGTYVIDMASQLFEERLGIDIDDIKSDTYVNRYLSAQILAIREVVNEHQSTINKPDVGFKGFVPAVFARLVNERFTLKVGNEVQIKVTAPRSLVRNRKALPDEFESMVIQQYFMSATWPTGKIHSEELSIDGTHIYRVMVPEYYKSGCLNCHGDPAGTLDITGYPKEGAKLGQLGGVISIQFFSHQSP